MTYRRPLRITYVERDGNRIVRVGGPYSFRAIWRNTVEDAIKLIGWGYHLYTEIVAEDGTVWHANIIVVEDGGRKYIRTEADGFEPNNLESLPTLEQYVASC